MTRLTASRWIQFTLYAVLSLCTVISVFCVVLWQRVGNLSPYAVLLSALLSAGLLLFFISLLKKERQNAHYVFLLVGTPALLGFCFFMLPDQVPDEIWHIYRVLNFTSSGNGGMVVPDSLTYLQTPLNYQELYSALMAPPDWNATHVVDRDMSSYLSHLYAAPGIIAEIGKIMNLNTFVVVYLSRMANVALFLVAAYWMLKIIPLGKTVAFVYLLNPMLLQQEASCSADAFVNAVSLLFIAYFLMLVYRASITRMEWVVLGILLILTSLSKYAYAPLALLLLFLVPKVVGNKRAQVAIYSSVAIMGLAIIGFVVFVYDGPAFKDALDLIRSPGELVAVLLRSVFFMGPFWLSSFGGGTLGPLTIGTWAPCMWAYFIMLAIAIFYNLGENHALSRGQKTFIGILTAGMVVMIILVFREWTINVDKRSDIIMGVQGRYLIPVFLLPLLCFVGPKSTIVRRNCLLGYSTAMAIIIACDLALVVRYFW